MPRQNQRRKKIAKNRRFFLSELRSGKYNKGTIQSDEQTGEPIINGIDDEGSCACAIMHDLFYDYEGTQHHRNYLQALGITPQECRFIQQKLNDTDLSFEEIANQIETLVFVER